MRARNIKPSIYKNEQLAECSIPARWLFPGLWQIADWCGRLENRPRRIKMEIYPADSIEVEPLLQELEAQGLILRYGAAPGAEQPYIWIPTFRKHQTPHQNERAVPSKLPAHPEDDDSTLGALSEHSRSAPVAQPERTKSNPAESGILNPESGMLNADTGKPDPESRTRKAGPANFDPPDAGPGNGRAYRQALWKRLKAVVMFRTGEEPEGRDPPAHEGWWRDTAQRASDAGLLGVVEEAVGYAEDCRDPVRRRAKDLGVLRKPAAFVAGKLRDAGLQLPAPPMKEKV